jgi:hypothetical protein
MDTMDKGKWVFIGCGATFIHLSTSEVMKCS